MTQPLARRIRHTLALKKNGSQSIGVSHGGLNTKIHAVCDALGNPFCCASSHIVIHISDRLSRCAINLFTFKDLQWDL